MTKDLPVVSVIIPVKNESRAIRECIAGFLAQTYPREDFEIVIAEQSDDGTREILAEYQRTYPGWIRVHDNPTGRIADGYNIALRNARGRIVNGYVGHAIPAPDYIERVVEALSDPGWDLVGGRVIPLPSERTRVAEGIAASLRSPWTVGRNAFTRKRKCAVRSSHWMAVRKEVIDRTGEFNATFERGEDLDWYERMMESGARAVYDPRILSYYYPRSTIAKQCRITAVNAWCRARLFCATGRGMRLRHILPAALPPAALAVCLALPAPLPLIAGAALLYTCVTAGASIAAAAPRYPLWPYVFAATSSVHAAHCAGILGGMAFFGARSLIVGRTAASTPAPAGAPR